MDTILAWFMHFWTSLIPILAWIMSAITTSIASELPSLKKMSEVMQVKRLSENAVLPTRGSEYAAGNSLVTVFMYVGSSMK